MIVIPTYNEAENINELVKRIRSVLPTEKILFVDDNSPDKTADEIRLVQRTDSNIELLVRTGKKGFAASYIEGFKKALEQNAEYIVTMDGDISHPAEKIPEMVSLLKDNDVVIGSRYAKGGSTPHWNIFRMILSRAGNIYAKLFSGLSIKDMTSGFMVIKSAALQKVRLADFHTEGYAFLMDLKNQLHLAKASFIEVPITFSERPKGKSKFSFSTLTEGILFPFKMLGQRILNLSVTAKGAWFVFLFSFLIYFLTAPRTILFGDNAEFITAVDVLGVPHPSGYPLYIMLAKAFSILPFGNIVFKVNLFSALCASLSLVLIYYLSLRCFNYVSSFFEKTVSEKMQSISASFAVLGFGFTTIFWYQAVVAKIYPLSLLVFLSICTFLFRFFETNKQKYIYLGAIFFGLSFSNHQTIILFLPVFVFILLFNEGTRKRVLNAKTILFSILFFIAGLIPYVYLPIASAANPPLDWGSTSESLTNWLNHIKRTHYADFAQSFNVQDKLQYISEFASSIFKQFNFFLLFALAGLYALLKASKKMFALAFGVILLNALGIILLRSLSFSIEAAEFYSTYYLPAYAFSFLFIITGIYLISLFAKKYTPPVLLVLTLGFFSFFLASNYTKTNFSKFVFVEEYSSNIFKNLTEDSVLVFAFNNSAQDTALFALEYQKYVNKVRPDVHVLGYPHTFKQDEPQEVNRIYIEKDAGKRNEMLVDYALEHFKGRDIYTTFIISNDKYTSRSNGFVYRVFNADSSPRVGLNEPLKISETDLQILTKDYFARELLKTYYISQATAELQQGRLQSAHEYFVHAINLSHDPFDEQLQEYIQLRLILKGKENI